MVLLKQPMLAQDPFLYLASCTSFLQPALHLEIHHILRMCYTAELVRVITAFLLPGAEMPAYEAKELPPEAAGFVKLVNQLHSELSDVPGGLRDDVSSAQLPVYVAQIYRLAHAYALPFVRKCVILMHVRHGIEFPVDMAAMALSDESELVRLSHALRLPTVDTIAASALEPEMATIISGWLLHWKLYRDGSGPVRAPNPKLIQLAHPAIFELVGLPKNYDTLQDEAMKRKCPKTGKDQTDPVICLFCGEIFCSQGVCCQSEDMKGGCWQHKLNCGGPIGMFLNIRKCMVAMLSGDNGSWQYAPYLDKHGETDATLRRHHQLYLHQKRYDKMFRDIWLGHGVQSQIARRLEGESNNGGWETL
jgi:E3 ubiquitin-protein ligase UBR1